MIKILNRRESGNLFHYAHFICDCLFPEIIAGIYKNKRIIREESISQTLGNFLPIYCMIMNCKCIEIELSLFDSANAKLYINKAKEELTSPIYFEIFRKYMFNRFKYEFTTIVLTCFIYMLRRCYSDYTTLLLRCYYGFSRLLVRIIAGTLL